MRTIRKRIMGLLALCFMALSLYPKVPVQAAYAGILGYEQNLKDGFQETIVYNPSEVFFAYTKETGNGESDFFRDKKRKENHLPGNRQSCKIPKRGEQVNIALSVEH